MLKPLVILALLIGAVAGDLVGGQRAGETVAAVASAALLQPMAAR